MPLPDHVPTQCDRCGKPNESLARVHTGDALLWMCQACRTLHQLRFRQRERRNTWWVVFILAGILLVTLLLIWQAMK